jgi:dCTP deaminase
MIAHLCCGKSHPNPLFFKKWKKGSIRLRVEMYPGYTACIDRSYSPALKFYYSLFLPICFTNCVPLGHNQARIMILTDTAIRTAIEKGEIVIEPFRAECLGTNSYDVHLGKHLATYSDRILDARRHNKVVHFEIPEEGYVIQPGTLYLGVTEEYTETHNSVPFLEGKSSVGRLGIDIHATAGKGDVGFCNTWTLEISCVQPVRIYAGMPIGQLIYFSIDGDVERYYHNKANPKYTGKTSKPVESMMWKNQF